MAQHDFPGGFRTHQIFGEFPEPIRWRARFTGIQALTRVSQLRQKLGSAQEQTLSWGDRAWAGRLIRLSPVARSQWLFDFDCEFWPRADLNHPGATDILTSLSQVNGQSALLQLRLLSLQGLITSAVNGTLNLSTLFPLVAQQLFGPLGLLIASTGQALLNAGGLISGISGVDQQNVLSASLAALAASTPLMQSPDPTISSPASDVTAYVTSIQLLIQNATPPAQWTISVINPNLYRLASQYLGSPSRWRDIADLNGITDPQPIGSFPALMIPPR